MKKRIIATIISMALVISLSACAGTEKVENTPANTETEVASDTEDTSSDIAESESADESEENADETAEEAVEELEVPALRDCERTDFEGFIGCAVTASELEDEKVFDIITKHFSAVTFGNELKPDCLFGYSNGTCPGTEEVDLNGETLVVPKMTFARAEKMLDKIYDWNEQNPDKPIKIRGHVLLWHSQTPEWFFHEDYDKTKDYVDTKTMNKRLEWYIRSVLTHFVGEDSKYKDMFYGWDVVNEAIADGSGTYRTDKENASEKLSNDTHGSNSSWWHVYESNEFIINAFKFANKYAPASLELYYNDYNECDIKKQRGIIELLEAVKAQEGEPGVGTRISGMGMQGHYDMENPNATAVESAIRQYSKYVDSVQITEFDLKASSGYTGTDEAKIDEFEKQRKRYNMLYFYIKSACKDADVNFTGITFWGTVDHYSWLQSRSNVGGGNTTGLSQCPLLFDENYEPKPCFYVFTS